MNSRVSHQLCICGLLKPSTYTNPTLAKQSLEFGLVFSTHLMSQLIDEVVNIVEVIQGHAVLIAVVILGA